MTALAGMFVAADPVQPAYSTPVLLGIALLAVLVLLFLIMTVKLHAFVSLVLVSLLTALATKVPLGDLMKTLLEGFGSTLASVALLVGLGAMIGRLLEVTGGAQTLADTLVARFGEKRAPLALGVASLLFGFPIFFDAGLVVMLPIIFSVARRFGGSVLTFALPAAGAFAVMHAFVPPHPGPVAAGELLGAEIGTIVVMGLLIGLPTWFLGAYLFGLWTGRRVHVPVPSVLGEVEDVPASERPSFGLVLGLLLLPLVLIFLDTGLNTLATSGVVDGDAGWVQGLRLLGKTPVALLITLLVAIATLSGPGLRRDRIEKLCDDALAPVCSIILITGAGGMFGGVLRASGIGEALAGSLQSTGMPVIVAAFIISLALRVAQGSATVALTTTAGLMAPTVAATPGLSGLDLACIVIAIACGATAMSHVNDSGFWLVGRFLDMDVRTTLMTWTVLETLLGVIGFVLAFVVSLVV